MIGKRKKSKGGKSLNKRRILALVIIFMVAAFFIYYSKPTKVTVELEGIRFNKNIENKIDNTATKFEGYIYKKISKPNTFRGHIYIDGKKYPHASIDLLKDSYSDLLYWEGDENSPVDGEFLTLGQIFIDENFSRFELRVSNEYGISTDETISAPASNMNEAEEVLQEIKHKVMSKY
jgi:hypothetical protein